MKRQAGRARPRVIAVAAVAAVMSISLGERAAVAAPAADPATLKPVAVVVLADESGSLQLRDVAAERDAANAIAQTVLAPGSRVSIVGFGSDNGQAGQQAVTTYCAQIPFDGQQSRDRVAGCVDQIHPRTEVEGNDTDQVNALRQAKSLLDDGTSDPKIVFLLTDGRLDVGRSPSFGKNATPDERQRTAQGQVPAVKAELERINAQVWPLGYGDVPSGALDAYTTGASCSPQEPNPSAQVVAGPADLLAAVKRAFQSATCVKFGDDDGGDTPQGGGQLVLTVTIPPIASDASILVFKRDTSFTVAYQGPSGQQVTGGTGPDGAQFDFIGQQESTESLHVLEPQPGTWTIVVSSGPGSPAQRVDATVAYQAAVNASIALDPPQPGAGQEVGVEMSVQARSQTITDPADLVPLTFVADLSGEGFATPPPVTLEPAGNGVFRGTITVPPEASGALVFTGRVSGVGIGGDTRVANTRVVQGVPTLSGQITLTPPGTEVVAGEAVNGQIAVTNSGSAPARLLLRMDDASPGVTVDVAAVDASPGPQILTPFRLGIAVDHPAGPAQATLRLLDQASGQVVAERLFAIEVRPAPTVLESLWWLWTALAVLLGLGGCALLLFLGRRRRARAVGGLAAQLHEGGFAQGPPLLPRDPRSDSFRFALREDFHGTALQNAGSGETDAWVVTRTRAGISLTRPGDPRDPIVGPGEQRDIGGGLSVVIIDQRNGPSVGSVPSGNPFLDESSAPGSFGASPANTAVLPNPGYGDPDQFADPATGGPVARPAPTGEFDSSYADPFDGRPPGASAPRPNDGYDPNNPF
ncbi:vWA domain-containing protein [Pseudonocardia lacus]|uniref:vWA domain-containing protein n=1 Tax=Pseudonocardia lacus TaxID=2835865 RepID=UPI001BDC7189|nr:vWA domain-containing protein [Pseudonocardia lacus]